MQLEKYHYFLCLLTNICQEPLTRSQNTGPSIILYVLCIICSILLS